MQRQLSQTASPVRRSVSSSVTLIATVLATTLASSAFGQSEVKAEASGGGAVAGIVAGPGLTAITPNAFAKAEGSGSEGTSLGRFSNTAQVVYSAEVVAEAGIRPGDRLVGLAFRVSVGGAWTQAPIWTADDYQIRLSTSANPPEALNPDFTANRGADYAVVRSGPVSYDGTEYPVDSTRNGFGYSLEFDVPFTYVGGDLLLEYTHTEVPVVASGCDTQNVDPTVGNIQFAFGFDGTVDGFGGPQQFLPIISWSIERDDSCPADIDESGDVGFNDLLTLLSDWGVCP